MPPNFDPIPPRPAPLWLPVLATLPVLVLAALLARHGILFFPDEGFYLTAAQAVSEGKALYRDHLYFQAPLLPLLLAPLTWLFPGEILPARYLSGLLLGGVALLLGFAGRRQQAERPTVALWGVLSPPLLLAVSYYVVQVGTLPVAYGSAATLSAVAALLALEASWLPPRLRPICAGALLAVATGIRLTFAPLLGVVLAWWLLTDRQSVALRVRLARAASSAVAYLLSSAVIWGPHLWRDAAACWFNNWTVHQLRSKEIPLWWDTTPALRWGIAAGVLTNLIFWHLPLLLLAGGWCIRRLIAPRRTERLLWAFVAAAALHGAVHLLPTPTWELYFATSVVLLVPVAAAGLCAALHRLRDEPLLSAAAITVLIGVAVWNVLQGVSLRPGPPSGLAFSFLHAENTHLDRVRRVATCIRQQQGWSASAPQEVFSFMLPYTYALQAPLPRGAEMSLFALFPRWTEQQCQQRGLLNVVMLERMLAERTPAVVLVEPFWYVALRGLTAEQARLQELLETGYERSPCSQEGPFSPDFPVVVYTRRE